MADNKKIKNVLVVDDEPTVLRLLEMTLRKAFKVKKFSSPIEALEFLKTGYKPGVIISDLMMPDMYGTEFLEKTIEIVPEAIRIIATAYSSSKEIIESINKAHAYMFIKKPWENIEVFQSVVVAWDKYENDKKLLTRKSSSDTEIKFIDDNSKEEIEKLKNQLLLLNEESKKDKETIIKLKETINDLENQYNSEIDNLKELAWSFSYIIHEFEKFWFTNHTESVYKIVEYLLGKLNLPGKIKYDTKIASLLHNITITQMPDNLKYLDPNDLNDKQRKQYFLFFSQSLAILDKVKQLSRYGSIISKIWEKKTGSGFPQGISNGDIDISSQIIALANIYHTSVYGLTKEQYNKLQINGEISQTYAETDIKHKKTIKDFYKKTSWFDRDLFLTFQDLIKDKICPELTPKKEILTINLKEILDINSKNNNSSSDNKNKEELVGSRKSSKEEFSEIAVEKIKVGMKTAQNIVTKTGMTIVKSETEINAQVLRTIRRFYAKGMLPKTLLIYTN